MNPEQFAKLTDHEMLLVIHAELETLVKVLRKTGDIGGERKDK